ncbi:hypothetical protein, partial [Salmonella sp. s51228]|uniref:hypothetical protein n=1 Tax=Salmonella sp. s51228 TaxID=3159652 RepID=UPI003980BF36
MIEIYYVIDATVVENGISETQNLFNGTLTAPFTSRDENFTLLQGITNVEGIIVSISRQCGYDAQISKITNTISLSSTSMPIQTSSVLMCFLVVMLLFLI